MPLSLSGHFLRLLNLAHSNHNTMEPMLLVLTHPLEALMQDLDAQDRHNNRDPSHPTVTEMCLLHKKAPQLFEGQTWITVIIIICRSSRQSSHLHLLSTSLTRASSHIRSKPRHNSSMHMPNSATLSTSACKFEERQTISCLVRNSVTTYSGNLPTPSYRCLTSSLAQAQGVSDDHQSMS